MRASTPSQWALNWSEETICTRGRENGQGVNQSGSLGRLEGLGLG